ncbi:hypothetical protein B0H10DRAFT_1939300 [Mycena sp. CBHHK59/15]|nr:hypothetical protein B0H10DRAFT_1939300 [Mycena sp. CBHHK59/15]
MPTGSMNLCLAKATGHAPIVRGHIRVSSVWLVQKEGKYALTGQRAKISSVNLFFKCDDGSDIALMDGKMYFPSQMEFEGIVKAYVVSEEDTEVSCKAHIGSIRHQGQVKYGNTAVSGVIASTTMPNAFSYNSWCSFVVNLVNWVITLFLEETWLHDLLASVEGQIPVDHTNRHRINCQSIWQAHDIINFVMDGWNTWKVLRQGKGSFSWCSDIPGFIFHFVLELLAAEQFDVLRLFELHMVVVEDLSRQHATEVAGWSRLLRKTTKTAGGGLQSVYQHESTRGLVLTIDNVLASLVTEEQEKLTREDGHEARTPVADWIHDGMSIECQQVLVIMLLESHREHPLQETWATITKLHDSLNVNLKKFREHQQTVYPRLKLSTIDVSKPELMVCCEEGQGSRLLGQAGITCSQRNLQKVELMKSFEITMYNWAQAALIHLGHMPLGHAREEDALTSREGRLLIVQWDSLILTKQGDNVVSRSPSAHPNVSRISLQMICPGDSNLEISPSKQAKQQRANQRGKKKVKRSDGWIWLESLMRGQTLGDDKLVEYKRESDRVQWFCTEAEMYRWLEQYKRKHTDLMHIIKRYQCDLRIVRSSRLGAQRAVTFACMQAAMYNQLEHEAKLIFKSAESGTHHNWVSATTFDKLVTKINGRHDVVFKWMDEMDIHRVYKDFSVVVL